MELDRAGQAIEAAPGDLVGCDVVDVSGPSTPTEQPVDDTAAEAESTAAPAASAPDTSDTAADLVCPVAADVSAVVGLELALAEDATLTTDDLAHCPYELAPPADPLAFGLSLQLSSVNVAAIDPEHESEEIAGLGEAAIWQDEVHMLSVWTGEHWTGEHGVEVTVLPYGTPGFDSRTAAIAVAELVG